MRRCCDLVEIAIKFLLAPKLRINVGHKPLGGVVKILRNERYDKLVPKQLIYGLDTFNAKIYCPVKHEVLGKNGKPQCSVADAIALTFICMKLSQKIQSLAS